jgi:hypothetical protein
MRWRTALALAGAMAVGAGPAAADDGSSGAPWLVGFLPVAVALITLAGGYANSLRLERKKAQLALVGEQLRKLYGPLFSLSQASHATWQAFRQQHRPSGPFFSDDNPPSEAEFVHWQRWMRTVFAPMNERMVAVIVENTDLIEGRRMPPSFLALIAHVEAYRVVLTAWDAGDMSKYSSVINFPAHFNEDVELTFNRLKQRQRALMDAPAGEDGDEA